MALIVEDGSGVTGADAFVSVADFKAYCDDRGTSYGTDEAIEQAIRRATDYVSRLNWTGWRVNARDQALSWPRSGVTDAEGYAIANNELPIEVADATCEVAIYELSNPRAMSPSFVASQAVKSEQVGEIKVEYIGAGASAQGERPVILALSEILDGMLSGGGSEGSAFGRSYRA
jgi:hypothetical protein